MSTSLRNDVSTIYANRCFNSELYIIERPTCGEQAIRWYSSYVICRSHRQSSVNKLRIWNRRSLEYILPLCERHPELKRGFEPNSMRGSFYERRYSSSFGWR